MTNGRETTGFDLIMVVQSQFMVLGPAMLSKRSDIAREPVGSCQRGPDQRVGMQMGGE